MELTLITIIFRTPSIIAGILMGVFAYQIFRFTRGGLRGWLYLAIYGFALFLWATTVMFFNIIDIPLLRHISGIIFLLTMALFIPLSYTKLARGFSAKLPRWLNSWTAGGFVTAVFLILVTINAWSPDFFTRPIVELLSISHLTLGITGLFACIPLYTIIRHTHKSPWVLAFLGLLIVGISLNVGQYYDNCCGKDGELEEAPICQSYDLDYVEVYDAPCHKSGVYVGKYYQIGLLLGVIVLTASFYKLWRLFRLMRY